MKKYIGYIVIVLFMSSCHTAKYTYTAESNHHGIEFREGKWLLNRIDCPADLYDELTEYCYAEFKKYLGSNLIPYHKAGNLIGTNYIPLHPSTKKLHTIKNGTGFDYMIHIKINRISEDMHTVVIGSFDTPKLNKARVTMEIYDLNYPDIIYCQDIIGTVDIERTNRDLMFTTSTDNLIKKSLKKIFKKIENSQSKNI